MTGTFIHFSTNALSTYNVLSPMLETGDSAVNRVPAPLGLQFSCGES